MNNVKMVIDNFNSSHSIEKVVEDVGAAIKRKSCCCPIHGGKNPHGASIDRGKNIFSCWTGDCGRGLTPWNFIAKYYDLSGFMEVAKKVNELYNTNIPIYEKGQAESHREPQKGMPQDDILKVNKYLSECNNEIAGYLDDYKHLLIGADTGLGKTHGIDLIVKNEIVDYVFFLVPNRSIAEQVAEKGYYLFYGDDATIPSNEKYIVSTYDKIDRIRDFLDGENLKIIRRGLSPVTYLTVIDEVHELKRDIKRQKRKDNNNIGLKIEQFVLDSEKSILMSANVKHISEIYKHQLYSKEIAVKSNKKLYNLDNLYIHRISGKKEIRVNILLKLIHDALADHSRVILYEDNKETLATLKRELDRDFIDSVVINSDNKDSEEVQHHYNSIIKDSKLSKLVILCTSVINAGVNIKNHNVALICIMNKLQFDAEKIEQFFGRLREDNSNTAYLILNQLPKDKEINKYISNFDYHKNSIMKDAEYKCSALNDYYFYKFGNDLVENKVLADWNIRKENDFYKYIKGCIYVENGIFKVDQVAVYEQARLEHLKFNYYDDSFITECMKSIKARKIHEVTIIIDETKIELEKKPVTQDNFKEFLINVYSDEKCLGEFLKYAKGDIRAKDFQQEHTQKLYEECKDNKLYKEMIKHLKALSKEFNTLDDGLSTLQVINLLVEQYTGEYKKSERDTNIDNLKRVEIYNKEFPIGSSYEDIKLIGDITYYVVRKNCDCFTKHRKIPTNRAYNLMLSEYIGINGGTYEEGEWFDKKGKKIKPKDIQGFKGKFDNCIWAIYNCSEKLHLYSLK